MDQIDPRIVRNLTEGAVKQGIDLKPLMERAGLTTLNRAPTSSQFISLMRSITYATEDELCGLLQRPIRIGTFALIAQHMAGAADLRLALTRGAEAFNLFDNTLKTDIQFRGTSVRLSLTRYQSEFPINPMGVEIILALLHRLTAWLGSCEIDIKQAWFDYPSPGHSGSYVQVFPRAKHRFNAGSSGLLLVGDWVNMPVVRTVEQAANWARRTPLDAMLPQQSSQELHLRVALHMEYMISQEGRIPGVSEVAEIMELPEHTFRRRLKKENVDFIDIKKQVRRDVAIRLLTTTRTPLEQISERIGFSEASAFSRAFQSWTGRSPRSFRQAGS